MPIPGFPNPRWSGPKHPWAQYTFITRGREAAARVLDSRPYPDFPRLKYSISGAVSHAGFDSSYFADDCPHTRDNECFCPVDGVEVVITRASGAVEEVTVNDGKFSTSAFLGDGN